jgi:hypothetical protein
MVMSPAGLRTEKACDGGSQATSENYRPALPSERAPHIKKPVTV